MCGFADQSLIFWLQLFTGLTNFSPQQQSFSWQRSLKNFNFDHFCLNLVVLQNRISFFNKAPCHRVLTPLLVSSLSAQNGCISSAHVYRYLQTVCMCVCVHARVRWNKRTASPACWGLSLHQRPLIQSLIVAQCKVRAAGQTHSCLPFTPSSPQSAD